MKKLQKNEDGSYLGYFAIVIEIKNICNSVLNIL